MEDAKRPGHLLLVEGDPESGASLALGLTGEGYAVSWMRDGKEAELALKSPLHGFEVALIGGQLPQPAGIELLRAIRRAGNDIPVLVLISHGALPDHLEALHEGRYEGIEDFLVMPFALVEVTARLRILARRHASFVERNLSIGALTLDCTSRTVLYDGMRVQLTAREYALLHALMRRPGALLSREQLEAHVYGNSEPVESNAIEFLLHGLRQKLGPEQIVNVRGVGWRVSVEPREG